MMMASRILGMGDVLTLIEKAEAEIDEDKAKEYYNKIINDYSTSARAGEAKRRLRELGE